ncbi:MAG TPA: TetR/AcrR family transcriptional regulator, partial [Burkholderiaceae bacterium]
CVDDAQRLLQAMFGLAWQYRFLYRNLNDLLSGSRHLETQVQATFAAKKQSIGSLLASMADAGALHMDARDIPTLATNMVVMQTYWLSFEYVHNPRHALEPQSAAPLQERGVQQVLQLLAPYLSPTQRARLPRPGEESPVPTPLPAIAWPAHAQAA